MKNEKLKIMLTGGNGFVGRNILETLGGEYVFLSPNSQELDLCDQQSVFDFLKIHNPDIIIHAAAVGGSRATKNQIRVMEKNLLMFSNLLACKQFYKRIIVLGSGAEYGKQANISNIKESDFGIREPIDEYGLSKYKMANLCKDLNFVTYLRLFGVYGKYEDFKSRFISQTVCKAILDLPITIEQNVLFDYMFVDDLVKVLDYFIQNQSTEIFYNIGRGESIDLITIAKKVMTLIGKDLPLTVLKPGMNNEYTCSIDKLKKEIKNFSSTSFDQSLKLLIKFYKNRLIQVDKQLFKEII